MKIRNPLILIILILGALWQGFAITDKCITAYKNSQILAEAPSEFLRIEKIESEEIYTEDSRIYPRTLIEDDVFPLLPCEDETAMYLSTSVKAVFAPIPYLLIWIYTGSSILLDISSVMFIKKIMKWRTKTSKVLQGAIIFHAFLLLVVILSLTM